MNFVLKLDAWLETNGLIHTSTTFRLYSDKDKTILIDEITDSDKLLLSINTDIPIGSTYYVVAIRHFDQENIDYESEVFAITNNGDAINNMILTEPVIVEEPSVVINKTTILEGVDTFTLRTSKYRGKGDGHTHTHWFVYDSLGLLFVKLNDVDNKTSIEIPKRVIYGKNKVIFKAIHCSNNIESPVGSYSVSFNKVNFEIISQMYNIPLVDYKLEFRKIDILKPMRLIKVNMFNKYGDLLRVFDMNEISGDSNSITITDNYLSDNIELKLEIYCYDESNKITKLTRTLYPIQNTLENQYIVDYVYLNEIESFDDPEVLANNSVGDIVNGLALLPKDNGVSGYDVNIENGKFTNVKTLNGVNLFGKSDDTYINYKNGYLVIDTYNVDKPTFMVYKHNIANDTFALLHTLERDEVKTVAHNNNIVQISLEEFIYNPYGGNKLLKYNFKTNVITELKDLPMNSTNSILIKLEDGRILVIGNVDHLTKIYRLEEDDYVDAVSIVPGTFIGLDLKVVELVNKDSLIFANNDTNIEIMYFNRSDYKLSLLDVELSGDKISTVIPLNGYTAFTGFIETNYATDVQEHTLVNLFK